MRQRRRGAATDVLGRGVLAGLAGTAVMTAFQKFVEMPATGRPESYAPADFAQRVLPLPQMSPDGRKRLNLLTHFALGGVWGTAYGTAALAGLQGMRAVNAVFVTMYTGDVLLITALGLYQPKQWTLEDWTIDLVDKYVQALATGMIFEHILAEA